MTKEINQQNDTNKEKTKKRKEKYNNKQRPTK